MSLGIASHTGAYPFKEGTAFFVLGRQALALETLPLKNPLERLEVAIKIAKAVNSVSKAAYYDSGMIEKWLKEFDRSLNEGFLDRFKKIEEDIEAKQE